MFVTFVQESKYNESIEFGKKVHFKITNAIFLFAINTECIMNTYISSMNILNKVFTSMIILLQNILPLRFKEKLLGSHPRELVIHTNASMGKINCRNFQ